MAKTYDVAVIGGGATGTGIARDAALRGLKTILIEKKDFSAGTTGACGGMIHGGSRYLLFDVETTRLSCIDSGYIQKIASNLIFRIPFLIPVMKDDKYGIEKWEAFLKVYDKFQKYIFYRLHPVAFLFFLNNRRNCLNYPNPKPKPLSKA